MEAIMVPLTLRLLILRHILILFTTKEEKLCYLNYDSLLSYQLSCWTCPNLSDV